MLESRVGRTADAWRDRLAGRATFNLSAAEAAVRAAYRASGLTEPGPIFWADGPADAAKAIIYLERPPRVLRRSTWALMLLGAAAAVILSLAIDGSAVDGSAWPAAVLWSAVIAGGGLAMGGSARLPEPPGGPTPGRRRELVLAGAACFLAIAAGAFALQLFGGLPDDPDMRPVALAVIAAAGTLPGVFLRLRIHYTYGHLGRPLAEASPSGSVAHRMEMQRAGAWAPFRRSSTGIQPDETLLQLHRNAHRNAFVRQQEVLSGVADRRAAGATDWVAVGMFRDLRTNIALVPPQHLDGMEDAARAAAADGAGSTGAARVFAELAFHVDRFYPFAAHAVAVQPPVAVALDAEGRPHSEAGPAIEWADGTQVHAWHGREVPWELIDPLRPVTFRRIAQEVHPELRSVLIERYGLGQYLLHAGATEVQRDDCGRLYRLNQFIGEPIQAVRVVNSTPEPDGHFQEFWLRVPPSVTTARQAVAWTFGLPAADYKPTAQS